MTHLNYSVQTRLLCLLVFVTGIGLSQAFSYSLHQREIDARNRALTNQNQRQSQAIETRFHQLLALIDIAGQSLRQQPPSNSLQYQYWSRIFLKHTPVHSELSWIVPSTSNHFKTLYRSITNNSVPAQNRPVSVEEQAAIATALLIRQPTATTVTRTVANLPVLTLFQPVFKDARILGILALRFDVPDLIIHSLKNTPDPFYETGLFDLSQQSHQPFYRYQNKISTPSSQNKKEPPSLKSAGIVKPANMAGSHDDFQAVSRLFVANRQWLMESHFMEKRSGFHALRLSQKVKVTGWLLTLLLTFGLWQVRKKHLLLVNQCKSLDLLLDKNKRALGNKKIEKGILNRALADSEQRARDFLLLSNDYFWELDTQFCFVFVSPQSAKIKGIAPEDLYEKSWFDSIADSDHDMIRQQIKTTLKQKKALTLTVNMLDSEGNQYKEVLRLIPLVDGLGTHIGYRGTGQRVSG